MKKYIAIAAIFTLTLMVQSCCVTDSCPGVTTTQTTQQNNNC